MRSTVWPARREQVEWMMRDVAQKPIHRHNGKENPRNRFAFPDGWLGRQQRDERKRGKQQRVQAKRGREIRVKQRVRCPRCAATRAMPTRERAEKAPRVERRARGVEHKERGRRKPQGGADRRRRTPLIGHGFHPQCLRVSGLPCPSVYELVAIRMKSISVQIPHPPIVTSCNTPITVLPE